MTDMESRTTHGGGLGQECIPACPPSTELQHNGHEPTAMSAQPTAGTAAAPPTTALSPTSSFDFSTSSLCTPPVRPTQATSPPPLNRRLSTSNILSEQLLELADPPNKKLNFTFVSPSQLKSASKSESKSEATSKSALFSEPGLLQPRPTKAPPTDDAHIKLHQSSSSFLFQGDKVIGYYPQHQQNQHQHQQFPRTINQFLHQLHPVNLSTKYGHLEESQPRKPLTSIAGSSRCLWPPDSAFWAVTGSLTDERRSSQLHSQPGGVDASLSEGARKAFSKNHERSDSFKDAAECLQALQPRRKARRVLDAPSFKEKNHNMVSSHVRKLIQEAVEDGVGELDLSHLDLDDLPAEIKDLNYAIVYNERGSFSLSKNRLKLFLSSNLFSTIPMDVFSLHNLSVLSLRNNSIEIIPPEIGLLHNLVELSVGGNHLRFLPSQVVLLPKLHILTIHPNPFLKAPDPASEPQAPPTLNSGNGVNASGVNTPETSPHASYPSSPFAQSLRLSSPSLATETIGQDDDVEMAAASSGQSSTQGLSAQSTTIGTEPSTAATPVYRLPPHQVKRSKVPSLMILAGSTILNFMAEQEEAILASEERGDDSVGRIRKDKSSMDLTNLHLATTSSYARSCSPQHRKYSQLSSSTKKRYVVKEETIKTCLTPYLYDIFKRARVNNQCLGCHDLFWKPCRILIVWQDILGQTQVPIEWKGCGIGKCSGIPLNMMISSPAEPQGSSLQATSQGSTSS